MFIDGKKLDLPASLAKRYKPDPLLLEELVMANWQICFKIHYWRFSATFRSSLGALTDWMLNHRTMNYQLDNVQTKRDVK
jgi:hypothetical protein